MSLKQSRARNVMVLLVDSADHVSGKTGATLAIEASKNGAAFASISPTQTERGDGWYNLALTASHTDTVGDLVLHIEASGADPIDVRFEVEADVAETLEARHGQGLWGPSYARSDVDAELMFPIASWTSSTDFAHYTFDGADVATRLAGFTPANTPTVIDGIMGPADGAVSFSDSASQTATLDDATAHDLSEVGDFLLACAYIAGDDVPRIHKRGGGTGWEIVGDGSGGLDFIVEGATTVTASIASCDEYAERGAVIVAALSRASGKMRVGIMASDGRYAESSLETAPVTTSATATALVIQASDDLVAFCDLMIAADDGLSVTDVPENLETVVRAYHARVFGATSVDTAAIADAVLDEALSGHTTAGTVGKAIGDTATTVATNLNATVSSRATQTSVDVIDGLIDALTLAVADLPDDTAEATWDETMEGSATYGDGMRAILSGIFGKVTNFLTGVLVYKGVIDTSKTRQTVVTDSTGRASSTQGDWT